MSLAVDYFINFENSSLHDSEGIIYLNSRGLARVGSPFWGDHGAVTPGCVSQKGIPEESFLILPTFVGYQKRFLRNPSFNTITVGYRIGSAYRPHLAPTHGYSDK